MFNSLLLWQTTLMSASVWSAWCRGTRIASGRYHPLNVVTVVHAWFSFASIVMEWVWGTPNYRIYTHLIAVNDSRRTWIAYYAFSIVLCVVFTGCARLFDGENAGWTADNPARISFQPRRQTRLLLWIGLISPILCALFAPDVRIWTQYAALLTLQPNADYTSFVNAVYSATYVALLCACGLILAADRRLSRLMLIGLLVFIAVWLNGKRNGVILASVLILFSLRMRGVLSQASTYIWCGLIISSFLAYSQWYQSRYRPILSAFDTFYETARMDFVRDADIRIALFAELEDARPILEYRGQSVLFDALFFVPRDLWEQKPRPYYFYITPVAVDGPRVARTWGIETTILGEAVANFGLLGLFLGPMFLVTIAVLGNQPRNPFLTLFTCVICTLFMSIQLAGFTVLWTAWCALITFNALRTKRRLRPLVSRALSPQAI